MIAIVNYGLGNLESIKNMLKKVGYDATITSDADDIRNADKLILPGVGAFDSGMENLSKMGLAGVLNEKVIEKKTSVLGICLGMQLMTKKSEEGKLSGLGWIEAETFRFKFENRPEIKIPHIGWNNVHMTKQASLFKDMHEEARFYFVHSYHVKCRDEKDVLGKTLYGYDFVSSFQKDNIFGVQFHPEKSHKYGMKLLKNFVENT